ETFAHRQRSFAAVFHDSKLARFQRGQDRHVIRINAELALRSGQRDHVHVLGINFFLRGNDLEFERHGFSIFGFRFSTGFCLATAVLRLATKIAVSSFASSNKGWTRRGESSRRSMSNSSQRHVSSASSSTMLVLLIKSGRDFA